MIGSVPESDGIGVGDDVVSDRAQSENPFVLVSECFRRSVESRMFTPGVNEDLAVTR